MSRAFDDEINAVLKWLYKPDGLTSVGVKANIAISDEVCHGGIKAYEDETAYTDSFVVAGLRDYDFAVAAILNMEEGALGAQTDNPWYGKTHNPLKLGYTPGGSSGGSAAAVAAGLVDAALGTDTMGSVRIPSGYCGLWGFKPSHSKKMLQGVMPLSPTLDTVGVHGKSLDNCIRVMRAIHDDFTNDDGVAGEITVLDWGDAVECQPNVTSAFHDFVSNNSLTQKTSLGPYAYGHSRRQGLIISEVEGYEFHRPMLEMRPEGFSPFFRSMLEYGAGLPKEKVDAAYTHMKILREVDLPDFILMPTAPQTAFKFGSPVPANQADFTAFANLANRPAIAFPIGVDGNGLPISAQLVGPRGREHDLIATVKSLDLSR